jgi:peptidoglycan hydrolase-like protein with peptidoglycan-binding domain
MKKIIEKLFGIDKLKAQAEESLKAAEASKKLAEEAAAAAERAKEAEETAKLSPKDRATKLKEPWVGVLNTHVNKDNIRNGFFELDWNDEFVLKLKQEGYGFDGDKDEEIIDRWFRELCANVVVDGDFGGAVNTGVIDIQSVKRNNK